LHLYLTVKSICTPFLGPDVEEGTSIEDVTNPQADPPPHDPNFDPYHDPIRVIDATGHCVGILWGDDPDGERQQPARPDHTLGVIHAIDG
jgi:hypothetical protein